MKLIFLTFTVLSIVSSISLAANETITCTNKEDHITLTIQDKGYDRSGRMYQGILSKNGEVIRTTLLRRAFVSNYFALYTPTRGRGGWSVNNDTENPRELQVSPDSEALRKLIGYSIVVKCNKSVPRNWLEN